MKRKTILKQGPRLALAACGLLIGASMFVSCKDDNLLTGQPSWLGNSIYERLQEDGHFNTTLKLIDDLDQHEVLSHTGSKTLFAANDEAYEKWFATNNWGVKRYEDLTVQQKKLLLNNSMINNAYLIELLSNVSGNPPKEGKCMRRETAATIYDSVYVMQLSEMPNTDAWAELKSRGKAVPVMRDATSAPMIHFLPAFMKSNQITSEDLHVMTNGQASSISEAWVNGKKVLDRDITCKNGYIHMVDGVIESSPNMAQIVHEHQNMSLWAKFLDRFSAPYYNATATREYNRMYNNEDSVFDVRYLSLLSVGDKANLTMPNGTTLSDGKDPVLDFDPGWNQFIYNRQDDHDLHYDAGVMIVPTDKALMEWWNGEGRELQDEYHELDSIPGMTISKLLRVNMKNSLLKTLPSKFEMVLNDAKEPLGIKPENVDSCFMGCNGIVYLVNKVFTPAEFASVAYPALAHESTMDVIYWGISNRNFLPYLLSMDSYYSLILPTNDVLLSYIDPCSYGKTREVVDDNGESTVLESPDLIEIFYDRDQRTPTISARRYQCTVDADGNITKLPTPPVKFPSGSTGDDMIKKIFDDMLNQLIIVGDIEDGHEYYKSKGGTLVRVTRDGNDINIEGGWQLEHNNKKTTVTQVYKKDNGKSYQIETLLPMGSQRSLYMLLRETEQFSGFFNLLENDYGSLLLTKRGTGSNTYNPSPSNTLNGNKNFSLFDNYNYTVFVPSNSAIEKLQNEGYLPTLDLLERGEDDTIIDSLCLAENWYPESMTSTDRETTKSQVAAAITKILEDFIRYHVMDHSVAIGMAPEYSHEGSGYESMKRDPETGRFIPLEVNFDMNSMTVKDRMGHTYQVQKAEGLYNKMCREYWVKGTGNSARIYMANDAMVHLIDGALSYEKMKPWRQVVREYLNK